MKVQKGPYRADIDLESISGTPISKPSSSSDQCSSYALFAELRGKDKPSMWKLSVHEIAQKDPDTSLSHVQK